MLGEEAGGGSPAGGKMADSPANTPEGAAPLAGGAAESPGQLRAKRACQGCACGTRRSPRPPAPAARQSPLSAAPRPPLTPRGDSAILCLPPPPPRSRPLRPAPVAGLGPEPRLSASARGRASPPASLPPHLPVNVVLKAVLGGGVAPDWQPQDGPWKRVGGAVGRGP